MKIRTHSVITTLCAAIASLVIIGSPARAGYIVTLAQAGPNVVANGSGAVDLTGLSLVNHDFSVFVGVNPASAVIITGTWPPPNGFALVDVFTAAGFNGPTNFGSGLTKIATSGSGDLAGLYPSPVSATNSLLVPPGYISNTALSDTATYDNATFSSLGVTPGTYKWTWGTGANQNFTLQIGPAPNTLGNISTRLRVGTNADVLIRRLHCWRHWT